ncbi:MAG: response regulator with CheY-like receiver domain and winged-helix DNA-binding domain [Puniceicoccaceae bacterium 5H]|nr:MAG: response regulator with CheY-like receiver domain and winged-helix DNA-binding domain [Puniceicoccaceae bacterium 5H]
MARILIIEDDQIMRQTLCEMLEAEGYEVLEAADGAAGIERARQTLPDLIISDLRMPIMGGDEVLATLRREAATEAVPFIFLTGERDQDLQRNVMNQGADDFLVKPVRLKKLSSAVQARLKRHSAYHHQLEQLRQHVTQVVSHEFNTPLNAILGYSSLLQEMLDDGMIPDEDLLKEAVQSIQEAGVRLHHLNSNFILYSDLVTKSPSEQQALREVEPIAGWLPALQERLCYAAQRYKRPNDLRLELSEAPLAISQSHFIKMIEELVDNAFKFSQAGQPVYLKSEVLSQDTSVYQLSISDHGRGFCHNSLHDISALRQIDRQRYMQDGVGLGWPIVKLIAQIYRATFEITSKPNEGTRIVLNLAAAATTTD